MVLQALLAGLIVTATAAFVVGTAIEGNSSGESTYHEAAPGAPPAPATGGEGTSAHEGGESAHRHGREGAATEGKPTAGETHAELRPLGLDVEAWPFVALAATASLGLAAAAWLRPRHVPPLVLVAAAMLVFAVLDVREVVHQDDTNNTGLAVLAAIIAALHLGAAAVAGVMASRARGPRGATPGTPGTMAA